MLETEFCFDFHLDLFQFLSGNEIETKINEIKTNIFWGKLGFYVIVLNLM